MQNKANFPNAQILVSTVITKYYENLPLHRCRQNKANSKPIKPNFNPNTPKTNPIKPNFKQAWEEVKSKKPKVRSVKIAVVGLLEIFHGILPNLRIIYNISNCSYKEIGNGCAVVNAGLRGRVFNRLSYIWAIFSEEDI